MPRSTARDFADARLLDLLTVDGICLLNDMYLLRRNLSNDADAEAWPRKRLTVDEIVRDTELMPRRTHLVLKEETQRLDDLLKVHMVGQSANIMMRLDHRRFPSPLSMTSG